MVKDNEWNRVKLIEMWGTNHIKKAGIGLITLSVMGLFVVTSQAEPSPTELAIEMALEGYHTEALDLLTSLEEEVKSGFDYRYARARILSWSGEYDASGQAFASLQADFPDHSDVEVSAGYLELFRGNLDAAEQYFIQVADEFDYYEDAQTGLRRVEEARAYKAQQI